VLKKARSHASLIVLSALELYRDLTLSALSLFRMRRSWSRETSEPRAAIPDLA